MKPNQQNTQQNTTTAPAWTPGPWVAFHYGLEDGLAPVYEVKTEWTHQQPGSEKDARLTIAHVFSSYDDSALIAAAPEMAEALRELLAWCESVEGTKVSRMITHAPDSVHNTARALLARINGGNP